MKRWLLLLVVLCGCDGITIENAPDPSLPPAVDIFPDNFGDDVDIDKLRKRRLELDNRNQAIHMLVLVDKYREEKGKSDLNLAIELMDKAQSWAQEMANSGVCRHSEWPAENVAAGQRTPEEVIEDWKSSYGHSANMLGDFEFMGAGCATGPGGQYWVLMLR